ncbi:MAG: phosphoribosylamine--glycine ligase [Proteobacteria bacterium]|nr:phosphoribosylamine--glycine ligase [Pseudomonadota bacterium]
MIKPTKTVLIIGSGGREHALAWKIAQSPKCAQVWVAPGNAGTDSEHKVQNVDLAVENAPALVDFAKKQKIDITIVGPELALAAGVVDAFTQAGLACLGPIQQLAKLETSKVFSKKFMRDHGIPTARYAVFEQVEPALAYAKQQAFPLVIKADGLAAGKGVIIAENIQQAESAILAMIQEKAFGSAGSKIVIEEFLTGVEMSFIVLSDGKHVVPLASSKDHKRRDDHDLGPNTGGMGAFSPAQEINSQLEKQIMEDIILPVIQACEQEMAPYRGFLYAGLMITPEGQPKVLEFNCRLGDPETQPIMMRLQSDLLELVEAAYSGNLNDMKVQWDVRPALAVILAASGYPGQYKIGETIQLMNQLPSSCKIFHAATQLKNNQILTNGGRVLAVTALGENLQAARQNCYQIVKKIVWGNCHYRTDIGLEI